MAEVASWQIISGDSAVGDSGKAIDVVGYTIFSKATLSVLQFRNGTSGTATLAWQDTGRLASSEQSIALAFPVRLSAGCFVKTDANLNSATIFYIQQSGS